MNCSKATLSFVLMALCSLAATSSSVKRGRNEGTINIPASNVTGNGNIAVSAGGRGSYGQAGIGVEPLVGATIGIAEIVQISARAGFPNFSSFGSTDIHLQVTTPGNDRLRFFGAALAVDLFLSTAIDTFSIVATSGKPDYNSYIRPSLIIDQDWVALIKKFPLKTYLYAGMADVPDLLYRYEQISARTGVEWKMYQHSIFMDMGLGLYKEKRTGTFAGDSRYEQSIIWIEPAARYRLFGRLSILGSLKMTVYQSIKSTKPLEIPLVSAGVNFEMPLLFRETNTEAIRTLVYLEQNKDKPRRRDVIERNIDQGKSLKTDFEITFEDLELDEENMTKDGSPEEALKKREEIQRKMEEIEKLLEGLE